MTTPSVQILKELEPLSSLPTDRLAELSSFFHSESMPGDADAFPLAMAFDRSVYVVRGIVEVTYENGETQLVEHLTPVGRRPIGKGRRIVRARTVTPAELVSIDDDLIDIIVTWNQIEELGELDPAEARGEATGQPGQSGWTQFLGVFSLDTLTSGVFASLPPAHIGELLQRFEALEVTRGQTVIEEGQTVYLFYVIESGRARVTRMVGGVSMPLADLKSGDAFGEEALLVNGTRNATVTMRTDGRVLRLAKSDFDTLLKEPLLSEIDYARAAQKVAEGAKWIDVRFPSEYQHDKIPGALNMPLGELRHALDVLDRDVEYIAYCQSGRRSAAAAFLLAQRGYRASVLRGGIWSAHPPG